jgi:hypothetical protein
MCEVCKFRFLDFLLPLSNDNTAGSRRVTVGLNTRYSAFGVFFLHIKQLQNQRETGMSGAGLAGMSGGMVAGWMSGGLVAGLE